MDNAIYIRPDLVIPLSEIALRFARSGGPGGQNVNKVATKVEARWNIAGSSALTESRRRHLELALSNRLEADGSLRVVVDESRSQWKNRVIAIERLAEIVREALRPKKTRVPTRPSRASKADKLRRKKIQSVKKRLRSSSRRLEID